MAQQSLVEAHVQRDTASHPLSLQTVVRVRLIAALIITLSSIICFVGTSWDIQWHTFIGRDRTLIPPHEMMLTGIGLSGIVALVLVFVETLWARQNPASVKPATGFAGLFSAPLGVYIAGYAALNAAVAFPLDSYWHSLYGIDVSIWAPFHVMIITGMALTALGAVYMFASTANLATRIQAFGVRRLAYLGTIVAWASVFSILTLMTIDGLDTEHLIPLGFGAIVPFPLLIGSLVSCVLVASAFIVPWKWAATSVFAVVALLLLIDQVVIPPAINLLMQTEQLTFISASNPSPPLSIVTFVWPLLTFVSAVLVDLVMLRAKKHNWSKRQLLIGLVLATIVSTIPVQLSNPTLPLAVVSETGVMGAILSLAVSALGIVVGIELGQSIAKALQPLEG